VAKTAKSCFVPPFGGLRGNVHSSFMARWKERGRLPISANWTFITSCYGWDKWILVKIVVFDRGAGLLWMQISGGMGCRPPITVGV